MAEPTLESLRAEGAHLRDPARFRYLEALSRRLPTQPAAVQRLLAPKLQAALQDYARHPECLGRPEPAHRPASPLSPAAESPLARLNRHIQDRAATGPTPGLLEDIGSASELKSVRGFGEVWSRISAERQVVQALGRGPDNAGPLNSHMLILRALTLMRSLSPDYLRRFLAQMDTLLWLDQANRQTALSAPRPARRARPPK